MGRRGERGNDAVRQAPVRHAYGGGAEMALPMRRTDACDRILLHVPRMFTFFFQF